MAAWRLVAIARSGSRGIFARRPRRTRQALEMTCAVSFKTNCEGKRLRQWTVTPNTGKTLCYALRVAKEESDDEDEGDKSDA